MTDPSLGKLSSARIESFHEEKDMIKIEESWVPSQCSHMFIYCFLFLNTDKIDILKLQASFWSSGYNPICTFVWRKWWQQWITVRGRVTYVFFSSFLFVPFCWGRHLLEVGVCVCHSFWSRLKGIHFVTFVNVIVNIFSHLEEEKSLFCLDCLLLYLSAASLLISFL